MSVIKINKENFAEEVLNSDKPVLLDFYADWCGPCRMVGPIVAEIAKERSDVKVGKVNVDAVQNNEYSYARGYQGREDCKSGCRLQTESSDRRNAVSNAERR